MRTLPALAALAIGAVVSAQTGTLTGTFDVASPTAPVGSGGPGTQASVGVVFHEAAAGPEFHVSSRGSVDPTTGDWISAPPHSVYVFDLQGGVLRSYAQDAAASSSAWGYRDGASDHNWSDVTLFWGSDLGIFATDAQGGLKNSYIAANGAQTLPSNPITGAGLAQLFIYRGLAFDPDGDDGDGSFWTVDLTSELIEIDKAGNVLQSHQNASGWSIYGLAFDPCTKMLWANASPAGGDLVEIDPSTGVETGRRIARDFGTEGGLDVVPGGVCRRPFGGNDLLALRQGAPDTAFGVLLNHADAFCYTDQEMLEVGADGVFGGARVLATDQNATVDVRTTDVTGNDTNGVLYLVWGPNASLRASIRGLLPGTGLALVECGFTLPTLFSQPMRLSVEFPIVAGGTLSFPAATLAPEILGGVIGMQALMLSQSIQLPNVLPLYTTNRAWVDLCLSTAPQRGVVVEASGANSHNSDLASGFFSITNPSSVWITRVRLTAAGDMVFDTDEVAMGDIFQAGNSSAFACAGTYRNGSDAAAGLDYAAPGLAPTAACASPGSSTGYRGDGSVSTRYVEFVFAGGLFANGVKFEFDCDTDAGSGVNGGAMAGMRVEIDFADRTRMCGVLAADPNDQNRSFAVR